MQVALGLLAGVIGFIPIFVGMRMTRKLPSNSIMSLALCGLGGFMASLILLVAMLVLCAKLARGMLVGFSIGEILTFLFCTISYVLVRTRSRKKADTSDEE